MEHGSRESLLESKSVLPLISVWEREEVHPCSAGLVCTGHAWKALSSCQGTGWRGGGEGFDKVPSAGSQGERELPQPAGKSDRHPVLHQLSAHTGIPLSLFRARKTERGSVLHLLPVSTFLVRALMKCSM